MFVGIVRDISERKRIELENERLLAEVKEADLRKDEFLAMLAHELRNPHGPDPQRLGPIGDGRAATPRPPLGRAA